MLICDRILKGAKPPKVTRPTFGESEGLLAVQIEKGNKTLTILAVYNEFDRPGFPINEKEFSAGVFREMSNAAKLKSPSRKKITSSMFVLTQMPFLVMSRKGRRV
jgi:hypothetical protein